MTSSAKRYSVEVAPEVFNTILADEAFLNAVYPGKWTLVDEPEEPTPPVDMRPEVVITNITVDPDHTASSLINPNFQEVTLPVGAVLTFEVELQIQGQLIPHTALFRMPLTSIDGRERLLAVNFVDGRATFSAQMTDSRKYVVTEETVNRDLTPEESLRFKGFTVYAVE